MSIIYCFYTVIVIASAVTLSHGDEWATLSGLCLGSAVGGIFGMLYTAFAKSASQTPWQIMVYRAASNICGGFGFGSIAVILEIRLLGWDPSPLMVIGNGFVTAWLAVAIARCAEPRLLKILQDRGDIMASGKDDSTKEKP